MYTCARASARVQRHWQEGRGLCLRQRVASGIADLSCGKRGLLMLMLACTVLAAARGIAYCGSIICICHIITWQRIALRILVLAFGMQHRKEGEARRGDGGNKLKATKGKEREGRRREQMRGEAKGRDKRREEGREGDGAEGGACTHGACKHTHTHTHTHTHKHTSLFPFSLFLSLARSSPPSPRPSLRKHLLTP